MDFKNDFKGKIFFANNTNFDELALKLFQFQSENNAVYRQFQQFSGIDPEKVKTIEEIPFLPVELFKTQRIITTGLNASLYFSSSGTSTSVPSRHYVHDTELYKKSTANGFEFFFGNLSQYTFLAILPSYLERNDSSLVYMLNYFMEISEKKANGFYLNDYENLHKRIISLKYNHEKVILFGVSFALLEFAQKYHPDLSGTTIIETGGMKGRGRELPRVELHDILKKSFNVSEISSEYGMTELLSQAYAVQDGVFRTVPWMKVFCCDPTDPYRILPAGEQGLLNIIDLANTDSCAFIATSDIGRINKDGSFEVLGRMDNSEMRGCNLLAGI